MTVRFHVADYQAIRLLAERDARSFNGEVRHLLRLAIQADEHPSEQVGP